MARKFGANCSKCQRSTEQQQSIKCFKIHSKDLLQNNDFHITSSIFLLSSVLVFYFFLILFSNSIVYRFFIARIFGVLPEYFRDWGGCRPPPPPRLVRLCLLLRILEKIAKIAWNPAKIYVLQTPQKNKNKKQKKTMLSAKWTTEPGKVSITSLFHFKGAQSRYIELFWPHRYYPTLRYSKNYERPIFWRQ